MANFVKNRVVIANANDEQVKKVLDFIKSDESLVDFNKVVPMPSGLETDDSTLGELGRDYILSFYSSDSTEVNRIKGEFDKLDDEQKKECLSLGFEYISNKVKYGYENWYDWSCANWGTKWNADNVEVEDNVFSFDTPWSGAVPVIAALSRQFPDVCFEYEYAEEEIGFNVGKGVIKNGDTEGMIYPEDETDEAYRISYDLWPGCEGEISYGVSSDFCPEREGESSDRTSPEVSIECDDDSLPF